MSVQRSSFPQKLLSTSSNLLKKVLYSSHFKCVFQKLWNKANKKAASAVRTFLKTCLRWSLFLEKLQTSASNLNTNQLHRSNLQRVFSKLWNNKKHLIFMNCIRWNHFRKNYRRLLYIYFKKEGILLLSFQKQPPDVFYEKRCPKKFRTIHRKPPVPEYRWQSADYKFIKKETLAQVFSCELRETSKNIFCIEHLPMTASVVS